MTDALAHGLAVHKLGANIAPDLPPTIDWDDYPNIRVRFDGTDVSNMSAKSCAVFDGTNQLQRTDAVASSLPITLVALFQTSDTANTGCIIGIADTSETDHYLYIAHRRNLGARCIIRGGGGAAINDEVAGDFADGATHFLAGVFTSSACTVTIDATEGTGSAHTETPTGLDRTSLGKLLISGEFAPLTGNVSQAMIFSAALTTAQLTWLRNSGNGRTFNDLDTSGDADNPGTTNLEAFYALVEESPTDRADSSGNGNTLTEAGTNPVTTADGLQNDNEAATVNSRISVNNTLEAGGFNQVQTTFASRPILTQSGGDTFLRFDGSDDNMSTGVLTESSQPNTIFWMGVIRTKAPTDSHVLDSPSVSDEHHLGIDGGNEVMTLDAGTRAEMTLTPDYGNLHVWCAVINGASSKLYRDGGTADTPAGTIGTEGWRGLITGDRYALDQPSDCDLYYVLMNNGELSVSEINEIGDYLSYTYADDSWTTVTA